MTAITIAKLTQSTLDGTGVFDVLMRANKAHLEAEFAKGRIKGTEYATVYLGSLQTVMATALQYVLQENKTNQDTLLMDKQIALVQSQINLTEQQKLGVANEISVRDRQATVAEEQSDKDLLVKAAQIISMGKEDAVKEKQALQTTQQTANLLAEASNIPLQGSLVSQQTSNLAAELLNISKQGNVLDAQKTQITEQSAKDLLVKAAQITSMTADDNLKSAQVTGISAENSVKTAQTAQIAEQSAQDLLVKAGQITSMAADDNLKAAQIINTAVDNSLKAAQITSINAENSVKTAQAAQIAEQSAKDLLVKAGQITSMTADDTVKSVQALLIAEQKTLFTNQALTEVQTALKVTAETGFIDQKKTTEEAQTVTGKIATDSYLGKQISVLEKQATGYTRDAEQKAAKIMADAYVALSVSEVLAGATSSGINDNTVSNLLTKLTSNV